MPCSWHSLPSTRSPAACTASTGRKRFTLKVEVLGLQELLLIQQQLVLLVFRVLLMQLRRCLARFVEDVLHRGERGGRCGRRRRGGARRGGGGRCGRWRHRLTEVLLGLLRIGRFLYAWDLIWARWLLWLGALVNNVLLASSSIACRVWRSSVWWIESNAV